MGREVEWESSERTVQVGGADLRLVDVGDPDAERVVVLLHGIAASWRWFTPVIPALSERARVLAVDLPGFGRSAMPPGGLTFDGMAAAVDELADRLGLGVVDVVGHSMGSIVGTRLAVDHPQRVRRLVLTGGPVLALTDLPRHPFRTLTSEPRAVTTLVKQLATIGLPLPAAAASVVAESALVRRVLMRGYVARPADLPPDVVRDVMRELGARGSLPALLSAFRSDPSAGLERICAPTLIVRGAEDPLSTARDVERFARTVPDVRVVTLDGVGHWPQIEAPGRFAREVVGFLDEE
ncbi:alpha/beta fold hydrolase [Aeromicrobium sp. CnD17-E]|uniref:alpha/beta fold hydrolase n=1 Tax=Aeromicrobium sp. CnD17-E TaxID=2954487 RepID=UPI002097BABF|nr:alpha/beta hydrolase [Aeromicrobium sp. CnD17-E]MCO7237727.1 alpha/beta hydrolase [Aeromicrobium sp. CnD17-E]